MNEPLQVRPILLVEDNPMDVDITLHTLEQQNVLNPIVVCRDGEEAMQYMESHNSVEDSEIPIIVLLDLRLPKTDGIDVLRHAKQHPVWKKVPFIVLTTSRETADIQSAYDLGVNSYIVKPVGFAAFDEFVKSFRMYWLLTNEPPF
jgi:CheY-like chemotaxis protein